MKKFREFAQVDEVNRNGSPSTRSKQTPPPNSAERMHKIIVDRLNELSIDRLIIKNMPRPSSTEWYEAYKSGKMIQLMKDMAVPNKHLGHVRFLYQKFYMTVTVGGSEDGAVIHLDIKFEYNKNGGRNGVNWVDRYDPKTNRWS